MARRSKTLERMRRNPQGDWRIEELETIARAQAVNVRKPPGSHVIFEHPDVRNALSVPAARSVKPVYVRRFAAFIEGLQATR